MKKTMISLSLLLVWGAATAQESHPDSTDVFFKHLELKEIVVTGLAGDSKMKEMSAPVSVIRPADLTVRAGGNIINAIAKAHGKSAAQVIIRWHLQKGFCVVPGSSNPAHIQENIESFSFTLSDDEMKQIATLNKEKRYFNMSYEQIKAWMGDYELWD